MGAKKGADSSDSCLGCVVLLVICPVLYFVWRSYGGWTTAIVGFILVGGLGWLSEKFSGSAEYNRIKSEERERLRLSDLKKRARSELIQEEFPELGSRQSRATIPAHIQQAVFERDGGRCVICGSVSELQFDHIIPYSKGGADTVENLRVLCRQCNLQRGNRFH